MKKGLIYVLLWLIFFLPVSAFADEVDHPIDDQTSIEEDFQVLDMELENYYLHTIRIQDYEDSQSYIDSLNNWDRFYVVGVSEKLTENEVQTYFYLFNPIAHQLADNQEIDYLRSISFNCRLNQKEIQVTNAQILDQIASRGLYKVKGFVYELTETAEITVTAIKMDCKHFYQRQTETTFKASVFHNGTDQTVTLSFDSTLIIEEMESVSVRIPPHSQTLLDGFFSFWENTFWQNIVLGQISDLYLTFYNFNFPNNIQPDTIDYAKFNYDVITSHTIMRNGITTLDETNQERVSNEYFPGTKTFQNNKYSVELDFDVFVLGNRIDKGEFGYIDFSEEEKREFDYDASILLDSYATGIKNTVVDVEGLGMIPITETKDVSIENIEFLELWYSKDDVQYRCQIVSEPIDPDIINPGVKKEWWEQIFEVFRIVGAWVLELFNLSAPSFVQTIVGGVVCFIGVLLIPAIIRLLINFISAIINLIF